MKARHNKTRWFLLSLLFGLLAATGLILTHRGSVRFVTTATQPVPLKHATMQRLHAALLAAIGGKQTVMAPVVAPPAHEIVRRAYSNDPQPRASAHSEPSSNATAMGGGPQSAPVGGADDPAPQTNQPALSSADPPAPQDGRYAYSGYIPLECGLPAGCGVVSAGHVSHPPSLGVGTVPVARNSQGSNPPDDGPNPQTGSDPQSPGPGPSVTAAPELDPATLAGAITLLLGSLAVLRGRRVRVARRRVTR